MAITSIMRVFAEERMSPLGTVHLSLLLCLTTYSIDCMCTKVIMPVEAGVCWIDNELRVSSTWYCSRNGPCTIRHGRMIVHLQ